MVLDDDEYVYVRSIEPGFVWSSPTVDFFSRIVLQGRTKMYTDGQVPPDCHLSFKVQCDQNDVLTSSYGSMHVKKQYEFRYDSTGSRVKEEVPGLRSWVMPNEMKFVAPVGVSGTLVGRAVYGSYGRLIAATVEEKDGARYIVVKPYDDYGNYAVQWLNWNPAECFSVDSFVRGERGPMTHFLDNCSTDHRTLKVELYELTKIAV